MTSAYYITQRIFNTDSDNLEYSLVLLFTFVLKNQPHRRVSLRFDGNSVAAVPFGATL